MQGTPSQSTRGGANEEVEDLGVETVVTIGVGDGVILHYLPDCHIIEGRVGEV